MLKVKLHPDIKVRLGYKESDLDQDIVDHWKEKQTKICKPCWELKYCPYGPLVEDFPLLPVDLSDAQSHNDYLQSCLDSGRWPDGTALDDDVKASLLEQIKSFSENDYPDIIPQIFKEAACRVFGHICPVFFVAEELTETKTRRKRSRTIPRDVMLKVVRRDGQVCQKCHKIVPDDEVEFDHIIPYSKGGTTTVENLKLVHRTCNREKGNSLSEILAPDPLTHYFELQEKNNTTKKVR